MAVSRMSSEKRDSTSQTQAIYFQGNSEFMATCSVHANSNATTANGLGSNSVYGVCAVDSTVYAATGTVHDRYQSTRLADSIHDPGNDGTVAVSETRIPGLTDHLVLPHSHFGMLLAADVAAQVACFLRTSGFRRSAA